jgi:hypothetical protein
MRSVGCLVDGFSKRYLYREQARAGRAIWPWFEITMRCFPVVMPSRRAHVITVANGNALMKESFVAVICGLKSAL